MKKRLWPVLLVAAVGLILLLSPFAFVVNFQQVAVVKTFGKAGTPIDGEKDAGLHFKWPLAQSVVLYDKRTNVFDDTLEQNTTADGFYVTVAVFCAWKVEDPVAFLTNNYLTAEAAEPKLRDLVRDVKGIVIGRHRMEDLVNTDPAKARSLEDIEKEMLAAVRQRAAEKKYGFQVEAIGVKAMGLPAKATESAIQAMQAERQQVAALYKNLGDADASAIRGRAETARKQILEIAQAKAAVIRSEGLKSAAKYYERFKEDERLAMYLRELDFLRESLRENAVFLLDPSVEHSFSFFSKEGPTLPDGTGTTSRPAVTKP